jgi:CubicO group peptidase (beta-lactamase class C family)
MLKKLLSIPPIFGLFACVHATSGTRLPPPGQGVAWPTSTPEAQGVDSTKLAAMVEELGAREVRFENAIHDFVIIRHGVLVAEGYVHPYSAETLHELASITKAVESALFGVAIREKWVSGAEETLASLLPSYTDVWKDEAKARITLAQALSMTAGFD